MTKRLWFIPPTQHLIIVMLATIWLNAQYSDGIDTYRRFKRWNTLLSSKPVDTHECKEDSDCTSVPNTSCAQDKFDKKYKCLCADSTIPNPDCKKLPKALNTPCQDDVECLPNAECTVSFANPTAKLCFCKEDYIEVNNTCSSGWSLSRTGPMVLVMGASLTLWRYY